MSTPASTPRVPPRLAAALLLIGLFAIGVVAGVAIERVRDHRLHEGRRVRDGVPVWALPERDQRRHWARVSDELGLTTQQRAAVDSILTWRARQLEAARAQVEPTMSQIMGNARSQIDSLLTPEQRQKLDAMRHRRAQEARR